MPLVAADVALLARAVHLEEVLVPHLVVGVVDLHAVVLEPLDVVLRQCLRDDLADPAAREVLLDGLGVPPVEVRLVQTLDLRRDRAAGERVRGGHLRGVVLVDDLERLEDFVDVLHTRVRATGRLVLAPVVVDVAVLALLLGAEVLADAERGQVDQVAPLDGRGHLHDRLPVGEGVPVVLGHRRDADVGDPLAVEVEAEHAVLVGGDAVRRGGVHPDRDDGPPQVVRAAGEDDLLGRAAQGGLAQLGQGAVVEGEDEVRLRLDLAALVVAERGRVEGHSAPEQILLEDGLPRDVRESLHQILDQRGTTAAAHPVSPPGSDVRLLTVCPWVCEAGTGSPRPG